MFAFDAGRAFIPERPRDDIDRRIRTDRHPLAGDDNFGDCNDVLPRVVEDGDSPSLPQRRFCRSPSRRRRQLSDFCVRHFPVLTRSPLASGCDVRR
jgi:hypothetical protein